MLDESGEIVSDPGCTDSSSDGLVAGVATAVGALVVVIIVVVIVVAAVVYIMMRKCKHLQQRDFEEPDFLGRYLLFLLTFTYIEYNTFAMFYLRS